MWRPCGKRVLLGVGVVLLLAAELGGCAVIPGDDGPQLCLPLTEEIETHGGSSCETRCCVTLSLHRRCVSSPCTPTPTPECEPGETKEIIPETSFCESHCVCNERGVYECRQAPCAVPRSLVGCPLEPTEACTLSKIGMSYDGGAGTPCQSTCVCARPASKPGQAEWQCQRSPCEVAPQCDGTDAGREQPAAEPARLPPACASFSCGERQLDLVQDETAVRMYCRNEAGERDGPWRVCSRRMGQWTNGTLSGGRNVGTIETFGPDSADPIEVRQLIDDKLTMSCTPAGEGRPLRCDVPVLPIPSCRATRRVKRNSAIPVGSRRELTRLLSCQAALPTIDWRRARAVLVSARVTDAQRFEVWATRDPQVMELIARKERRCLGMRRMVPEDFRDTLRLYVLPRDSRELRVRFETSEQQPPDRCP